MEMICEQASHGPLRMVQFLMPIDSISIVIQLGAEVPILARVRGVGPWSLRVV